jgi:hypothetical protein
MTDSIIDWIEDHLMFDPEAKNYNDYMLKIARTKYNVDVNKQVEILQDVLNELMTGFESPEDRWDFILDIVNGYKDRILTNK